MKYCLPILLLLFSPLHFNNAYGEVNKWVDDNNQIHYSDQPAPSSAKITSVKPAVLNAPNASLSDAPAQKSVVEREVEYRKAQKAKEDAEKKEAKREEESRAKQKYCEDARSGLTTLENSPRISTYDSNGGISYMDDDARKQRIEELRKGISTNCN